MFELKGTNSKNTASHPMMTLERVLICAVAQSPLFLIAHDAQSANEFIDASASCLSQYQ